MLHAEDKELFIQSRKDILHIEGKEIFEYIHSSYKTFQIFQTFQTFQSFMTFSLPGISTHSSTLQYIPVSSSASSTFQYIQGSTPLQHSPIRMHILHIGWFPQKLHRVPVETLQSTNFHSSKKGRCCDISQNTYHVSVKDVKLTFTSKIELIPAIVLSSGVTN